MGKTWHAAFFVDETWAYDEATRSRIAQHIDSAYLDRITQTVQVYLSMQAHDDEKPGKGQTRKQLNDLAAASQSFLAAAELDGTSLEELERYSLEAGQSIDDAIRAVRAVRTLALVAERDYNAKGAPRKESRRFLVHRLAEIWAEAQGTEPTREVSHKYETSPFAYFVRESVAPLDGFNKGLDDLIREAVESRKN